MVLIKTQYDFRNIGIAFQLVDDLLDFVSSADQLGKPAAADLKLGLATAPVLFAARMYPELNALIQRRFSQVLFAEIKFLLKYNLTKTLRLSPSLVPLGGEQYHSSLRLKGTMTHSIAPFLKLYFPRYLPILFV